MLDDPGMVREVVAAARLGMDNERLHAEVLAQLEDLRAAQARIVAAGDAERRRLAIDELRELAHGIYPAVLADEGLAAAVEALAEISLIPVMIGDLPQQRLPPPVEAAGYFLIA